MKASPNFGMHRIFQVPTGRVVGIGARVAI
jgi:hypothetical protein